MKNQFAKIVAVLMVLAMAVSVFGICAFAAEETKVAILGDVNLDGRVTIQDASLIQKAIAKISTLDEVQTAVADAYEDGDVNIKDATAIQKWIAKFEDANENIGKPIATDDEATKDEATKDEATKDEATKDEATKDEATTDESTKDEATTDEATKDEETPVDPATKDEETPVDPATKDEATTDEATADELAYYLVGHFNGVDYGIGDDWANNGEYLFVDGTVTVEFTEDSYVIVKDSNGVGYWTNGWLDFGPTSAVLGEFGADNNKMHVAAGTVTFTWDAETLTLAIA